jgi:hypothetical protein
LRKGIDCSKKRKRRPANPNTASSITITTTRFPGIARESQSTVK